MLKDSATFGDAVAYGERTETPLEAPDPQAPAGLERPSRANGADDGRCSCGAGPHPSDTERCARGHVLATNDLARQHGAYAQEPPPDVQAHVERFTAGIVTDLGGETELSTLERGRIRRLAGVEGTLLLLEADIGRRGLLTPAGGVRRIYDDYLDGVRTWDRVASRLPSGRRPRRVPSLDQWIAEHAEPESGSHEETHEDA